MEGQYNLYLFSENSTIEENNTTYDNWNILVYNCTLTVNGQHSFTNLKLLYNSTLTHPPTTSEKEYQLRIEITENLIIDSSSKIDVSNRGYKIGYTKGNTTQGGATGKSGGSYGGLGYGDGTNAVYGNYKDPQYPGSGGGTDWSNGGSGGGLIRINAGRVKIDGSIKADGGNGGGWADPAGSGGGILINTGILEGSGSISANGGNGYVNGGSGGGGRIAIYYENISNFNIDNIKAIGGTGGLGTAAVGTIYLKDKTTNKGKLIISSYGSAVGVWTPLGETEDTKIEEDEIEIKGNGVIVAPEHQMEIKADKISIKEGAKLTHKPTTSQQEYSLILNITDRIEIDTQSSIDVSNRGYKIGYTKGNTTQGGATGRSGGSYGGLGYGDGTNAVYGNYKDPQYPGSGGGTDWSNGGSGGGLIRINAGRVKIDGSIKADGGNGGGWADPAGSGGGILINTGILEGSGSISANGGNGYVNGGSGGGGRIAIYYENISNFNIDNIKAIGGTGGLGNGHDGTVWFNNGEKYFDWIKPEGFLLHGNEEISFSALGVSIRNTISKVYLINKEGISYSIGETTCDKSLFLNTESYTDGKYQLVASFYDLNSIFLGQISKEVIINNSVVYHSGRILSNETWAPDKVHIVEKTVIVSSGVTLTILPGTIVKFAPGTTIIVETGAILNISGEENKSVVLTSIYDDTGGDINMDGDSTKPGPGDWYGICGTGTINMNEFTDLRYTHTNHSGTLTKDEIWSGRFVHRIVGDLEIPSGKTLTIEEGAIIKFDSKKGISVRSGGKLISRGTNSQPVIFTSVKDDSVGGDINLDGNYTTPSAGDWRWVYIEGEAYFEKTYFYYGGGTTSGNWDQTGMIRTTGNANVIISRCILKDSYFDGVLAWGGNVSITNSIFTGIDRAVCAHPGSPVIINNSTFDDNRIGLLVHGGTLTVLNSIISNSIESGIQYDFGTLANVSYCNVWSNQGLNYRNTTDLTGTNGNISADPKYKNKEKGDYNLDYLSPCIDASDSTATETDFSGNPRYTDPRTTNKKGNPLPDGSYADMGALEFVETASSNIDLVVDWVTAPEEVVSGTNVTISWQARNAGTETAIGPWHNQVIFVPVMPTRDVKEIIVDEVLTNFNLAPGESKIVSTEVKVPGGTEGAYNWQIKINSKGEVFEGINSNNNLSPLSNQSILSIPELTLGSPFSGSFTRPGEEIYFKINQIQGQQILINLSISESLESNKIDIYAGYNSAPTIYNFDLKGTQTSAQIRLGIPSSFTSRVVYIMLYPEKLNSSNVNFTIEASLAEFKLDSIGISQAGNSGKVTIPLIGSGFTNNLRCYLKKGSDTVQAETIILQDSTYAYATFDLTGISTGIYDVVINQEQIESILPSAFVVDTGKGPKLISRIILPKDVRVGRKFKGIIEVVNEGDADLSIPLMIIKGNDNFKVWALDKTQDEAKTELQFIPVSIEKFSPPVIIPGQTYSFQFYGIVNTSGYNQLQLLYKDGNSQDNVDWEQINQIVKPQDAHPLWDQTWQILINKIGNTYADYINALYKASQETVLFNIGTNIVEDLLTYMVRREMSQLPTANVIGILTIEGSNEYQRVPIVLYNSETDQSFFTTSWYDGRFSFLNVAPGTYQVLVNGYIPDVGSTVNVGSGITNFNINIEEKAKLAGRIIDKDTQKGISDVSVVLSISGNNYSSTTDNDGYFSISSIPEGTGYLYVYSDDYVNPEVQSLSFTKGEITNFVIYLNLGGSIKGKVVDSVGSPLKDSQVKALGLDTKNVGSAITDENGEFVIKGLDTGTYTLIADKEGYGAGKLEGINVIRPQETKDIQISLVSGGNLTGTITDINTGQPIANVVVSTDSGDFLEWGISDSNGMYTFSNINPGLHKFYFQADAYLLETKEFVITEGETATLNISLNPGGIIEGVVKRLDNTTIPNIEVVLFQEGGYLQIQKTDGNGNFNFNGLPDGTYILALKEGGSNIGRKEITISQTKRYYNETITLNFAKISGKVLLSDGTTPDTSVEAFVIDNGKIIQRTYVDDNGNFGFLFFKNGNYEILTYGVETNFIKREISINVGEDINLGNLIPGQAQLNIAITHSSQPVVNALVSVRPDNINSDEIRIFALTDENGRATISNLSYGTYIVEILPSENFAGWKGTVNISGVNNELNIALSNGTKINGVVLNADNEPVSAEIRIKNRETGNVFTTSTDENGQYSIDTLPEGTYDIYFINIRYQPYLVEGIRTYTNTPRTVNVNLSSGGSTITGYVYNSEGKPLVNIPVSLTDFSDNMIFTAWTDTNGQYKLSNVNTGIHKIIAKPDGFYPVEAIININTEGVYENNDFVLGEFVCMENVSGTSLKTTKGFGYSAYGTNEFGLKSILTDLLNIPVPAKPYGENWEKGYQIYKPYIKKCDALFNAYYACVGSEIDLNIAFDNWFLAYEGVESRIGAEWGLIASKGLLVGSKALLTVASLGKQALKLGPKAAQIADKLVKWHIFEEPESIVDIVKDGIETAENLFEAYKEAVSEFKNLGVAELIKLANERRIAFLKEALKKLAVEVGDKIVEKITEKVLEKCKSEIRPKMRNFVKGIVKAGVASIIDEGYETVKEFFDYADEVRESVDKYIMSALDDYEKSKEVFLNAVERHARNMAKCKAAAEYCQDGEGTDGGNPPIPPGPGTGGTGGTTAHTGFDPNTKLTAGVGENGYIADGSLIVYTIYFENKSDASAPAQEVEIDDYLDENLDWSTLQLLEISFNNTTINIPKGVTNYKTITTVPTDPNPVKVEVSFNTDTGKLNWHFWSYDSTTGELPEDPFAGFLPPNNEQHQGEGYVSFAIRTKNNLQDATTISNQARIIFDVNPPIDTPVVKNTIDKTPPSSYISPLPPIIKSKNIQLTINGSDTGSGIDFYEIYVSTDNSPYVLYASTNESIVNFQGDYGKTYKFYSIAVDRVGNKENSPATPDATTKLEKPTYTITATAGEGGSISPSGEVVVNEGEDKTFTITPNQGYQILDVKVDGISIGVVSSYTFTNVTSNHTISASFTQEGMPIIEIEPEELNFAVNENTKNFKIKNIGRGVLIWSISNIEYENGDNWITSITPSSGTVSTQQMVQISVSREFLENDTYIANINISSNGGNKTLRIIMVGDTSPNKPSSNFTKGL
jgi:hypothetical protein